jgi:hypothetical protein
VITVEDIDRGWEATEKAAKAADTGNPANGPHVLIGVQGKSGQRKHPDPDGTGEDLTNVELATIHEFGLNVPQRSFIRATIDQYAPAIGERAGRYLQRWEKNQGDSKELERGLRLLGEYIVGLIKQRIDNHIPPPNSPITIKIKGSATPLIRYGHLKRSITYEVYMGGGGVSKPASSGGFPPASAGA